MLVIKLLVGSGLGAHPLLAPEGELDGAYYRHFAERVNAGDPWLLQVDSFFGQPPAAFFISPLYIYVLALFLKVGGSLETARGLQLVLGSVAVLLVGLTARRWYGDRAGWFAGALAAGCGLLTFYESLILQASLDPFLTALDLYLLTRALQRGRRVEWILAGAAFGLHALNRPNMLIVFAGIAVVVIVRSVVPALKRRPTADPAGLKGRPAARLDVGRPFRAAGPALLFVAAGLVVIAPATLRNWRATGEFVLISSHGGLNFLTGNGPEADGTFVSTMGIAPNIRGQWIAAPRVASEATGRAMSASETSAFFMTRALDWIGAHPVDEARLLLRKTWYALSGVFLTLNHSYPFFAHDAGSALRLLAIGPLTIVPLGLLGLLFARPSRDGYAVWAAFIPFSILSVVLFFVAARYRLPYQVALIVCAGGGLSWIVDCMRLRAWRALVPALAVLALSGALVAWPTGLDDGRAEEQARMGLLELERGNVAAGESWIARAVARHGFPGVVHLRAGQVLESRSQFSEALTHYQQALAIDPGESSLRLTTGRLLTRMGRLDEARTEFDRVSDAALRGAVAREYERLGLAMAMAGRVVESVGVFEKALAADPQSASMHLNLAVALATAGRTAEARREAEAALTINPGYERARQLLAQIGR